MKKIIFTCLGILFFVSVIAQNKKNYYEISFGMQRLQNKTVYTIQPYIDCFNGAFRLTDIREESINLPSFTFLRYNKTSLKDLSFVSGVGFNQKGYIEKATRNFLEPNIPPHDYSRKHIFSYVTANSGISYRFLTLKKLQFSISEIVNLEMQVRSKEYYPETANQNALSLNSFLIIELPVARNSALIIKPFFQTVLTKLNQVRNNDDGKALNNNYKPYGFGLSVGINF